MTFSFIVIILGLIIYLLYRIVIKLRTIMFEIMLLLLSLLALTNAQLNSIDLRSYSVNGNYANANETELPFMTSTVCLYYPQVAETQMADPNWQDSISQLFITKGWPRSSIYYQNYQTIHDFSQDPQFYCDYNIVMLEYNANSWLDISEIANQILFDWECNPMNVTLYYYSQVNSDNKWLGSGTDCTVKVCPLNSQTLGIGCSTTDDNTFETITQSERFVIIDVVDDVNYKISFNQQTCTLKNCIKKGERLNVAMLQVGGPDFIDLTSDPVTLPKDVRLMRIQWKKWWQVFYTVVDYINDIVQIMFARARSLDVAQFYYRR